MQWQELVVGFRDGMPRQRRRVKMRQYEECFTGSDAVIWLHEYLKASGTFGAVSKDQVYLFSWFKNYFSVVIWETLCACHPKPARKLTITGSMDLVHTHVHVWFCERQCFESVKQSFRSPTVSVIVTISTPFSETCPATVLTRHSFLY